MTIEEFVATLGIAEEKQAEAMQKVKEFLDGDFVTRAQFNEVDKQKKSLTKQMADRDKQLSNLKKTEGLSDTLKKEIEALQRANKEQKAQFEAQTKALQFDTAIKLAVAGSAQDAELVAKLIPKEKLVLGEDGKIAGLKEQIDALQKEKPFLFKGEQQPAVYNPNGGRRQGQPNPFQKETFNLTAQGHLFKQDPAKARALAAEVGVTL